MSNGFPVVHIIFMNKDEIFGEVISFDEDTELFAIRNPMRIETSPGIAFQLVSYTPYSMDQNEVCYFDLSHIISSKKIDDEYERYYFNMVKYLQASKDTSFKNQLKAVNSRLENALSDENIAFIEAMKKYNIDNDQFNDKPH